MLSVESLLNNKNNLEDYLPMCSWGGFVVCEDTVENRSTDED